MSGTTSFAPRPVMLGLMVLVSVLLVAQGVGTVILLGLQLEQGRDAGLLLTGMALGAVLPVVGLLTGAYALRRLRDGEPSIAVGPQGLHDRALSQRPIPWDDIEDLRIVFSGRGGKVLTFALREGAAERAGVRETVRALVPLNALFGYSYWVRHIGTMANPKRLAFAIGPFAQVAE